MHYQRQWYGDIFLSIVYHCISVYAMTYYECTRYTSKQMHIWSYIWRCMN